MKSKFVHLLCGAVFAISVSACSTTESKKEETQVPEMSVNMPAEIPTETGATAPVAEEQSVKDKKADKTKKKSAKKKKSS